MFIRHLSCLARDVVQYLYDIFPPTQASSHPSSADPASNETKKPGGDIPAQVNEKTIVNLAGLARAGLIEQTQNAELEAVEKSFSIRLTPIVLHQLRDGDCHGPVYKQYVPSTRELEYQDHELSDPIGDQAFEVCKGVTHRYTDRVLLKPTHTCQVYCRFCFRREKVGSPEEALSVDELANALDYIRQHKEIWEVILTGGDPLILSDRRLKYLVDQIAAIEHVEILRLHTRIPLVDPSRIRPELLAAFKGSDVVIHTVIHVNHADELTAPVLSGLAAMVDSGIPLFSQTVLLKGVNDDADTLANLFRCLVKNRVKPYYLHHLDKARGVGHFRTSIEQGQCIMRQLRGRLSGLCLPTYVLDIPGGFGKVPIGPEYLQNSSGMRFDVTDVNGRVHSYYDEAEIVSNTSDTQA